MGKNDILPKRIDILDVDDPECVFRINVDVLNEAFGVGISMYVRASYPAKRNTWIKDVNSDDNYFIWMGNLCDNSAEWINRLSEDGKTLFEVAEYSRTVDWTELEGHSNYEKAIRLAFVRDNKKSPFRFVGVFENGDMTHLQHTYRRIATKVRLIGNPVYKIELLDDIRRNDISDKDEWFEDNLTELLR